MSTSSRITKLANQIDRQVEMFTLQQRAPPILNGLKQLFESKQYSDLTITAGGGRFAVHRSVICTRSPVLEAQCNGHWIESEARLIETTHDPQAMACFIEYLYLGTYKGLSSATNDEKTDAQDADTKVLFAAQLAEFEALGKDAGAHNRAILHAKVHELGEFYDVPDLKVTISDCFMSKLAQVTPSNLAEVIEAVYSTSHPLARGLRDTTVSYVLSIRDRLNEVGQLLDFSASKELGEFAIDYTTALADALDTERASLARARETIRKGSKAHLDDLGKLRTAGADLRKMKGKFAELETEMNERFAKLGI